MEVKCVQRYSQFYLMFSTAHFYRTWRRNCQTKSVNLILNSWPTFSPYLYKRVFRELTTRNPPSRSRVACLRLSGHIHPSVNRRECEQTTYGWGSKPVKHNHSTSELQRLWIKLVRPQSTVETLAKLVYSTVDSCLTITSTQKGVVSVKVHRMTTKANRCISQL